MADGLTPEEVEARAFALTRRGYDPDEVDGFLSYVAAEMRVQAAEAEHAESGTEDPDDTRTRLDGRSGEDDYERLGAEVAAVLRSTDETAARVRQEAEADRETAAAEVERARHEAAGIVAEAQEQAESLARDAEEVARVRGDAIIAESRQHAGEAARVERTVHGRLVSARDDLDRAVIQLDPDQSEAAAVAEGAVVDRRLGHGPPTPPVPPPDDVAPPADEPTDVAMTDEGEPPEADEPPPPPPPPDLPYDESDDDDERPPVPSPPGRRGGIDLTDEPTVDITDDAEDDGDDADDDPLAAMVRDAVGKAVNSAMDEVDEEGAPGQDPSGT
jgi:DivIVA domain-containing protein